MAVCPKNEPIFDQAVLLENLKKAIKINITFAGWVCMALIIPSAWRCVLTMPMPIKLPLLVSLHPLAQILLLVLSMIFERDDGYQALSDTYGYHFKNTKDLDIGLKIPNA